MNIDTPDEQPRRARRRLLLNAMAGLLAAGWAARPAAQPAPATRAGPPTQAPPKQHFPFGPVEPVRPVPALKVTTHEGRVTSLPKVLRGRVTAAQTMFTGCSAICPIQGALFAQTQQALAAKGLDVQLLSISIDPLGDTPKALARWLEQFGRQPGWLAVAPQLDDVGRLSVLLGNGGERIVSSADVHSGQVFIFNARGELAFRTPTMPSVPQILSAAEHVSRAA